MDRQIDRGWVGRYSSVAGGRFVGRKGNLAGRLGEVDKSCVDGVNKVTSG